MSIKNYFKNAALIATILAASSSSRAQSLGIALSNAVVNLPTSGDSQVFEIPPVTLNISSNNYSQYQVNLAFTNNYTANSYDVAISSPNYSAAFELGSPTTMSLNLSPGITGGNAPINTVLADALEANGALTVTYTSRRFGLPGTTYKFAVVYDIDSHKVYAMSNDNFSFNYGNIQTANYEFTSFPSRNPRPLQNQTFKFVPK